jgi:restriction system-associated AAA family ATPase
MRLLRVHVIAADTCGGLLDGLDLWLRSPFGQYETFEPLCLIGPNGTGKSQFLQVLAEIFQAVFHAAVPEEERIDGNTRLQFEIEYLIRLHGTDSDAHVRIARLAEGRRKPAVVIQQKVDSEWADCGLTDHATLALLPPKVVGYTSGDNETLSLPFLLSRGGYAKEVGERARNETVNQAGVPDTKLMLIDYGTHLEVLVANLLLGTNEQRTALLQDARLRDVHSFRCIVQLAHSTAPKAYARRKAASARKRIQLTQELEDHLDRLRRCATCYAYEERTETYIFDFLVDDQTRIAFRVFWGSTLELYSAFHKLSMLNDLAIPKTTRERYRKEA